MCSKRSYKLNIASLILTKYITKKDKSAFVTISKKMPNGYRWAFLYFLGRDSNGSPLPHYRVKVYVAVYNPALVLYIHHLLRFYYNHRPIGEHVE